MKKTISNIFLGIFLIIVMGIFSILYYKNIEYINKLKIINKKYNNLIYILKYNNNYEGKNIRNFIKNNDYLLQQHNTRSSFKFTLYVMFDSINCFKCLEFHLSKIKNLKELLRIIFIVKSNKKYIKVHFNELPMFDYSKYISHKNMKVLFFCNENGKIIYSNKIKYNEYMISNMFYDKIIKLIKS